MIFHTHEKLISFRAHCTISVYKTIISRKAFHLVKCKNNLRQITANIQRIFLLFILCYPNCFLKKLAPNFMDLGIYTPF